MMLFRPDQEIIHASDHSSYMFHCTIGLDPLGNFTAVEGLSYEIEPFPYAELGRNHSPWQLPFAEPGKPGELTLRWGMILRSKLYHWMHQVEIGADFRRHIYIFHLSKRRLPIRVYHLTGAWPKQWEASNFTSEGQAEMATTQLTLVYEQMDMVNTSLLALAGAAGLNAIPKSHGNNDVERGGLEDIRAERELRLLRLEEALEAQKQRQAADQTLQGRKLQEVEDARSKRDEYLTAREMKQAARWEAEQQQRDLEEANRAADKAALEAQLQRQADEIETQEAERQRVQEALGKNSDDDEGGAE